MVVVVVVLLLLLSHFSRVWLCATPETAAHQAPPSLGFSRQEHWSGLPLPSPTHESEKGKWSRSVVSDSSRPHGLQPTRLLHPWDFPGKRTGVGCHCLLPCGAVVKNPSTNAGHTGSVPALGRSHLPGVTNTGRSHQEPTLCNKESHCSEQAHALQQSTAQLTPTRESHVQPQRSSTAKNRNREIFKKKKKIYT